MNVHSGKRRFKIAASFACGLMKYGLSGKALKNWGFQASQTLWGAIVADAVASPLERIGLR